jgi:hypothetical protein
MVTWEIEGREFGSCNCNYGCPCQFNALPTHGHCRALAVFDIEQGFHGSTRLNGLRAAGIFRWPGPIHEGEGEGWHFTGGEHRVRIVQPNGFEFAEAEIGRGWAKITGPISFTLEDTYGQFAHVHLCQSGMVR